MSTLDIFQLPSSFDLYSTLRNSLDLTLKLPSFEHRIMRVQLGRVTLMHLHPEFINGALLIIEVKLTIKDLPLDARLGPLEVLVAMVHLDAAGEHRLSVALFSLLAFLIRQI